MSSETIADETKDLKSKTSEYGSRAPEKKEKGLLRRHKLATAIGATGLILVGAYGTGKLFLDEQYAEDPMTGFTAYQVDNPAGGTLKESSLARKLNFTWNNAGSLQDVADKLSKEYGYYIDLDKVVELNSPRLTEYATEDLPEGVNVVYLPPPETREVKGQTFVRQYRPENFAEYFVGAEGKIDIDKLALLEQANIDEIKVGDNGTIVFPEIGFYDFSVQTAEIIEKIAAKPGITDEAIENAKQQAVELGLIS